MGIVSEPWGQGKGLVTTNYRDTSGDGGHGLGRRGSFRRHGGEERPTPGQPGRAAPVGEEPEVADPDEAAGEDVEEKAREELLGRQDHRSQAIPPGVVPPPEAYGALGQTQQ